MERVELERAFDMLLIQFLNNVSYLKAKEHHDKMMIKNARTAE